MNAGSTSWRDVASVVTQGRRAQLRSIGAADVEELRQRELAPHLSRTWRFQGATPSPQEYASSLWAGVSAQFVVVDSDDDLLAGLVTLYDVDQATATASVAVVGFEPARNLITIEGFAIFLDFIFAAYPLRKLYGDCTDEAAAQFASVLDRFAHEEARLRTHHFRNGTWVDRVVLAVYRDEWLAPHNHFRRRATSTRGEAR